MADYPCWQKSGLEECLATRRVVMLTGPRQCGKSTLSRTLHSNHTYLTLDDLVMRQAAQNDPHLFVEHVPKNGTLIIDEVQKAPDLLSAIKKVVDTNNRPGQFLLTGSANILKLPTVVESLAGRTGNVRLRPLSQGEVVLANPNFIKQAFAQNFSHPKTRYIRNEIIEFIFRGGFPEAIRLEGKSRKKWHVDYIDALIGHDLNDIAQIRQIDVMKDLVLILAAWSSKFMDVSAIGAGLAADRRTIANYTSALQSFYIIESLPAWRKTDYDRVNKQNKPYMADTGMMTALLGWKNQDLSSDGDKTGKAFETFAYNELAAQVDASEDACSIYHYRDRDKREIDFLIEREDNCILAVETQLAP